MDEVVAAVMSWGIVIVFILSILACIFITP